MRKSQRKARAQRRSNRAGRSAAALIAAASVFVGGGVISAGAAHAGVVSPAVAATSVVDSSGPKGVEAALEARAEFWADPEVQAATERAGELAAARGDVGL